MVVTKQTHGELATVYVRAKLRANWMTNCLYDHKILKGDEAQQRHQQSYLMVDMGPTKIFLYVIN